MKHLLTLLMVLVFYIISKNMVNIHLDYPNILISLPDGSSIDIINNYIVYGRAFPDILFLISKIPYRTIIEVSRRPLYGDDVCETVSFYDDNVNKFCFLPRDYIYAGGIFTIGVYPSRLSSSIQTLFSSFDDFNYLKFCWILKIISSDFRVDGSMCSSYITVEVYTYSIYSLPMNYSFCCANILDFSPIVKLLGGK